MREAQVEHTERQTPGALTAELRETQRTARSLLRLVRRAEDAPDGVVESLEDFAEADIPRAKELARAALAGVVPEEGILILWRRAKQAFHAAAPAVMDMYFEKMEKGSGSPYSERLLVEAMKGMGMMVPGEPVSEKDRETGMSSEDVQGLSNEELMERLRAGAGFGES